jgi:ParB-like chromosome segregation protein Spo0J
VKKFKAEIVELDPNELTPYVNNIKKHPTEQIDKLAGMISKFGFDQPIVVDAQKVIIKGHGRREAALRLGLKKVPVIIADHLNEHEVMAARIADNKVAESEWDNDALKFELGTLQREEFDLELTGFSLKEIEKLTLDDSVEESEGEDEAEEEHDDTAPQFIVAVECEDEVSMQELYDELKGRGLKCKLIT